MPRNRHQEWLEFLRRIDAETQKHLDVHLIADNYATHKHANVQAWLKQHPRFHMYFTPTSASWINQVERFFGLITGDRIRCGLFKSVAELVAAIEQYLEHHNADPKPFIWTASATAILEKVARGRQALGSIHYRFGRRVSAKAPRASSARSFRSLNPTASTKPYCALTARGTGLDRSRYSCRNRSRSAVSMHCQCPATWQYMYA